MATRTLHSRCAASDCQRVWQARLLGHRAVFLSKAMLGMRGPMLGILLLQCGLEALSTCEIGCWAHGRVMDFSIVAHACNCTFSLQKAAYVKML